jgi:hypothetical protein
LQTLRRRSGFVRTLTNPQGAANLSGSPAEPDPAECAALSGGLGQNHPFKYQAWHLHGLGDFGDYQMNRPFDPWELYSSQHHAAGLSGIGALGDATSDAVNELQSSGAITPGEAEAILDGSMGFQDVIGYDPTDQGTWTGFIGTLQSWNNDLKAIEAQVAANPAAAAAIGRDVIAQRNKYIDVSTKFIYYWNLFGGTTPSGLSGLGIAPIVWFVAGSAVFLISAFLAYQAFQTWKASINVNQIAAQTQQTAATSTAATNQNLLTRLAAAQASGDTTTAAAILKTLQVTGAQPAAASSMEQWLMTNAKWLALGAAGLIAIGPISSGLFGGGRRR